MELTKKTRVQMEYNKYVFDNNVENHWDYCCDHCIPFITLTKKGEKYSYISFDCFPLSKYERFTIISFSDHIIPLYKFYTNYSHLPKQHYNYAGGGRCLGMTVFTKDAEHLCSQLFDFLLVLAEIDEERFKEKPFEVDELGNNSEGFAIGKMTAFLKGMSDEELISMYQSMEANENFKYRPKEKAQYESELASRNIKV